MLDKESGAIRRAQPNASVAITPNVAVMRAEERNSDGIGRTRLKQPH